MDPGRALGRSGETSCSGRRLGLSVPLNRPVLGGNRIGQAVRPRDLIAYPFPGKLRRNRCQPPSVYPSNRCRIKCPINETGMIPRAVAWRNHRRLRTLVNCSPLGSPAAGHAGASLRASVRTTGTKGFGGGDNTSGWDRFGGRGPIRVGANSPLSHDLGQSSQLPPDDNGWSPDSGISPMDSLTHQSLGGSMTDE